MARMNRRRRHQHPPFYEVALSEADRVDLEAAREVQGIDDEIALLRLQLRLQLRHTLEEQPVDHKLLLGGVRLLLQALLVQRRLSPAQADGILESVTSLIEGVAAFRGAPDA